MRGAWIETSKSAGDGLAGTSPPVRGAWIETAARMQHHWSPPVRGAWIETTTGNVAEKMERSPPVRGAWIETSIASRSDSHLPVASREGGVD